jgi:eukaryotic-like serine/threonine-protein kinase
MPLVAGTVLGSYKIFTPLGAGGMGEVYRARDTKLGRDVAIKILPEGFADDPDRIARFQREAQVLAALNHPHIAAIHGLEESNAVRFLVLEFVDGQSLADRLAGGNPLPTEEALALARQIMDALEAAHEKAIIHRDLKPANIMLTVDGQVKVLDFGLAKVDPASAAASGASAGMTHSPTLTFAATQAGVILGTAAYMSPEQAKGRPADKRSDVWAFGCVVFEMLTGRRAFEGEDVSDTLAAILRGEPDWSALPSDLPGQVRTIVMRCLQKDRKARIPDISVVRFLLDEPSTHAASLDRPTAVPKRAGWAWQAATVVLATATAAATLAWYVARSSSPQVTRFFVSPPEGGSFFVSLRTAAQGVISPDGRTLAFAARDAAGKVSLWIRPIESLTAQSLPGTDDATNPFWSPDSRFIGYSTPGKLMKIGPGAGPPQTLCELSGPTIAARGGAWNRDGVIVFSNGPGQPLHRVSSAGGRPSPVGRLAAGQSPPVFPSFLPDGRHMLVNVTAGSTETSGVYIESVDTGELKQLLQADSSAVCAARCTFLLFVRQGTLLAQAFDARTLSVSGEPFPVAERVESVAVPGVVSFSVSTNGTLAYGIGSTAGGGLQMVWVDRSGKALGTVGPPANFRGVELSPDGSRIAWHRHDGSGGDLWITDVARGTTSRLTFDASQDNSSPLWSPDGAYVGFASMRDGKWGLYRKLANNAAGEELLADMPSVVSGSPVTPFSWSPDGRSIVYASVDAKSGQDLWLMSLAGDRKPIPLVRSPFTDLHGQVSPDGRWLAYWSVETGRPEVYVQAFPTGTARWQVSTGGGQYPRWRHDGRELFYMTSPSAGKMMAVEVKSSGAALEVGTPQELFDSGYYNVATGHLYNPYAVSADGSRFLIPRSPTLSSAPASAPIAVVVNWASTLNRP